MFVCTRVTYVRTRVCVYYWTDNHENLYLVRLLSSILICDYTVWLVDHKLNIQGAFRGYRNNNNNT